MLNPHVFLAPHRPTLLVDEQRGHHTPMLDAFGEASETFWGDKPEVVVALSARWNAEGPFRVDSGAHHRTVTDYSGFGVELRYDCPGHPALARALVAAGTRAGVRVAAATRGVDSGVTVPLHFLASRRDVKVVPLSLPDAPAEECRAWGAAIAAALERWSERVTFVAGGVLSFNEHAWNLRRDVPEAEAFDKALMNELGRAAWSEVATMVEEAPPLARPEAGLRHVDVLRGVIGEHATAVVRAYEGTFGIGAALVEFTRAPREPGPAD